MEKIGFFGVTLKIHPDEFALFLRFLPFSPLLFQMLIFKCHKKGQKCDILIFSGTVFS